MPPDTSIFAHGASIIPDFITPAEETRILLRISQSPWLTDLHRRVQHYGFRYSYNGGGSRQKQQPASRLAERSRCATATPGARCASHPVAIQPEPFRRAARAASFYRPSGALQSSGELGGGEQEGPERAPTRSATFVRTSDQGDIIMSFGLNSAQVIGRLGADVAINQLASGGRVANLSIATDESYINKQSGERVDRTEWHRVVTFQSGLVDMLEKHATKGRLVYVAGKMQTRRYRKAGEDVDRFSTEIILVPGGRVQFLDKPNGNGAPSPSSEATPPAASGPSDPSDMDDEIPF